MRLLTLFLVTLTLSSYARDFTCDRYMAIQSIQEPLSLEKDLAGDISNMNFYQLSEKNLVLGYIYALANLASTDLNDIQAKLNKGCSSISTDDCSESPLNCPSNRDRRLMDIVFPSSD